jgi:hypothetical protein
LVIVSLENKDEKLTHLACLLYWRWLWSSTTSIKVLVPGNRGQPPFRQGIPIFMDSEFMVIPRILGSCRLQFTDVCKENPQDGWFSQLSAGCACASDPQAAIVVPAQPDKSAAHLGGGGGPIMSCSSATGRIGLGLACPGWRNEWVQDVDRIEIISLNHHAVPIFYLSADLLALFPG